MRGVSEAKFLKGKYDAKLEILEQGDTKQITFVVKEMDILWKHTIQRANYYYWFGDQAGGRTGSIHRDMSKKWLQSGEGGGGE